MRLNLLTCLILLLLHFALFSQSDVYMKIQKQGFQPVPIDIQPVTSRAMPRMAEEIRTVLINDLEFSGFFYVIKQNASLPAMVRIESTLKAASQKLVCEAILTDISSKQTIFRKTYEEPVEFYRRIPHRLADDIVLHLIGDYGVSASSIACVHKTGQTSELVLMDYDGRNPRVIVSNNALNLSPAFSPDGKQLIHMSFASGNPDLWIIDLTNGNHRLFTRTKGAPISAAWSPGGGEIVYAMTQEGNTDIYTVTSRGDTPRRLTSAPAIDCAPSWSPDGREIVFTSDRSGSPQIYLMDARGGNIRRLTFTGSYNDSPVWSPRGDLITYVSRETGGFQIYTIDITGESIRRISDGHGNHEDPAWSPDGFFITYASNKEGQWDIYITSWDGKRTHRLTRSGGNVSPAWSPKLTW